MASKTRVLLQGNQACVAGAMYAGMRFFAGYPITPSTEIAENSARELPKVGGRFIQMEDEIGSIAAVIGASVSGLKSMTGTSGPVVLSCFRSNGTAHRDPARMYTICPVGT